MILIDIDNVRRSINSRDTFSPYEMTMMIHYCVYRDGDFIQGSDHLLAATHEKFLGLNLIRKLGPDDPESDRMSYVATERGMVLLEMWRCTPLPVYADPRCLSQD